MPSSIAVVTDSTAGLAPDVAAAAGVRVVPLHVLIGDDEFTEGVDITQETIAGRLRRGPRVSTSRPSPAAFLQTYEELAAAGADGIVSAHLSAELSGTCEAARLAARAVDVPVRVVDTGTIGLALGHAVVAGASLSKRRADHDARVGGTLDDVAQGILDRCRAARVLVYVHTLEYLRRGGRIGAAASLLGGALAVKPLVALVDGHLEPAEKLRTTSRALGRLVEVTVDTVRVSDSEVRVDVQHFDAASRARKVADELAERLDVDVDVVEMTAVVGVHTGPGAVATIVSPVSTA